ncbi:MULTISPECIES: hypothetical protein [Xanthomonas]|uniref:Uncharacterized protein n=1 Tax=Xanthomonas dyei TaxID=743699 RepID=A0ABZ0DG70_9XANT|nr:hypothetical protein [Xanthomonas dyei]WOB27726.1 hypothetical protein NYR99_07305 [Xanthomonas dyei]WOB55348.1 hypothetical protein NYR95_07310 [Xanthomonas dyei]
MSRVRSTLFAPVALSNSGGFQLLPMPPSLQAIYDAAQRGTPYGTELDDALAAHRQAHGEPAQIAHAQRLDPCDAMPATPNDRRDAYVRQRRYAVRAGIVAGMAPVAIAQALGVSPGVICGDVKAIA